MKLFFLEASVPLTKTFSRDQDGQLEKESYPFVKEFTSHEENVTTVEEFHQQLLAHANQGHCLLKGTLEQPLKNESRAGTTNSLDPTRWLVFDLDGLDGLEDPEAFIQILPKAFHNTSYLVQHSASSGFDDNKGLRLHLFFLLDAPVSPATIKEWLTMMNLETPLIAQQLGLSANAMALRFPLDRTVCQNDKLIYIAPPICEGIDDPIAGKRIQLIKKSRDQVTGWAPAEHAISTVQNATQEKINELRQAAGMAKKIAKYSTIAGLEILTNPDKGRVTGEKWMNGFVRVNLNGGDSWGYYYNPLKPRFLHNFKGEPAVVLADFLPEYYHDVVKPRLANAQSNRTVVFRDKASDTYWAGLYDTVNERLLELHSIKAKDRIKDFCANCNQPPPDPIPDWDLRFDPTTDTVVDFDRRFCNRWQPTETIKLASPQPEMPPTIHWLLDHVVGHDTEAHEHFLNWLAFIYQRRVKTGTAWVLHGTQGTGKGLLFNHVLAPIFGREYCVTVLLRDMEEKFNAYMETTLLLNVDEARLRDSGPTATRMMNKLKNNITEPLVTVRGMRENLRQVASYTNYIFTSNEYDAIDIGEGDRRFNVAPRQEKRIDITPQQVRLLEMEAFDFAGYLKAYPVDEERAYTVLNNSAKREMRTASQNTTQQFAEAVRGGDLDYFISAIAANSNDPLAHANYKQLIARWADDYFEGRVTAITQHELCEAYNYILADRPMKSVKFARMMSHKNLHIHETCRTDLGLFRGIHVTWLRQPDKEELWRHELKTDRTTTPGTVVSIR